MLYSCVHRHANEVLKNETTMFEKYLKRVDPKDIGLQQAGEFAFIYFANFINIIHLVSTRLVFIFGTLRFFVVPCTVCIVKYQFYSLKDDNYKSIISSSQYGLFLVRTTRKGSYLALLKKSVLF